MTTIVSHRYHYIFFHIPKNAGSSIQATLMRHESLPLLRRLVWRAFILFGSGKQTVTLFRLDSRRSLSWSFAALEGHAHAIDIKDILPGKIFDSYFKFAIVRNPWDRCVSRYAYYRDVNERRGKVPELATFEAFLEKDYQPQKKRIANAEGNLLVNFVGRMETLDADMHHIYKTCGLPIADEALPRTNRSNHRGYRDYYDARTRELVRGKYRDDVEAFGYEF